MMALETQKAKSKGAVSVSRENSVPFTPPKAPSMTPERPPNRKDDSSLPDGGLDEKRSRPSGMSDAEYIK